VSRRELPVIAGPKGKPAKAASGEPKSLFASMFKKR
jgi:hypothetical protein